MKVYNRFISLLVLCVALSASFAAQTGSKPKASKNGRKTPPVKKESREKPPKAVQDEAQSGEELFDTNQALALDLLRSFSEAAKDIKDLPTRIRVQAQIADALWETEEPAARELFELAFRSINSIDNENNSGLPQVMAELSQKFQLRSEILRLAALRDAELTEKLIKLVSDDKATEAASSQPQNPENPDNASTLCLRLASSLVDIDLPRAVVLTKKSVDFGLNQGLAAVLFMIRRKDPAIADDVALYALSSVRMSPIPSTMFINYLGPYVFPRFGQGGSPADAATTSNPILTTQFLDLAYQAITQQDQELLSAFSFDQAVINYMTIRALVPYFDSYMPDRAARIRLELNQRTSRIPNDDIDAVDLYTDSASSEDLARRADKVTNRDLRNSLFAKAALIASAEGNVDRALAIVENVSDIDIRSGVKTIVYFQAASRAIQSNDVEAAYKYAKAIESTPHQVFALSQIAQVLANKKLTQEATEILNEAFKLSESKLSEGEERVRAMLTLSKIMSRVDKLLGFEFMQSAVRAINSSNFSLRSRPSTASAGGPTFLDLVNVNIGFNKNDLQDAFSLLSDSDYLRTVFLATSIRNKEVSILAQLAVVRSVLRKTPIKPAAASNQKEKPKERRATSNQEQKAEIKLQKLGKAFVDLLAKDEFDAAIETFDESMRKDITADKLQEHWSALIAQAGQYRGQVGVQTGKIQEYDMAVVECEFELAHVFVRVVFNNGKVSGLLFYPASR